MRRAVWLLVVSVVTVGILFLFVFPTRTLVEQRHEMAAIHRQLSALDAENASLRGKVAALHQSATIERIAGQEFGLVMPGQKAYAVIPAGGSSARHGAASHAPAASHASAATAHRHWWRALELWRDL